MTNMEDKDLIDKVVKEAFDLPQPETKEEKKPYLFQTARHGNNMFPARSSSKWKLVPKLDADGKEIPHGNKGIVYTKVLKTKDEV